jgi:hypothetical protein
MKPRNTRLSHYLLLLILLICGIYIYFFSYIDSNYSPYYGDEFFYFKNAQAFFETSHLQAVFSYSGKGSSLLALDAHGPAYPLLYGSVSKLIGWFGPLIPIANFTLLIITLVILMLQKEQRIQIKFFQIILVLGSPITLFYSFSFMPELLQIAGAILLFIQFKRYLKSQNAYNLSLLIVLILILGFIRSTWFFALIGLAVYPTKIEWRTTLILVPVALGLAYLSQVLLHESVPNTFSGIGELIQSEKYSEVFLTLFYNLKRNIFFALTYTEGKFYTLQKIWMALSILLALLVFRKEKLVQVGLLIFGMIYIFNMVLYKNYSWVDLRMYTSILIFINLGTLSATYHTAFAKSLVLIGFGSFILILPLNTQLVLYRVNSELKNIPISTHQDLLSLTNPLILVDALILQDYALDQLPISTGQQQPIRYILPYYKVKEEKATHLLTVQNGHIKIREKTILNQNANPKEH